MAGDEYADRTRAAYVLHMLDEFIHHGAEIALLRDLWRWQHPTVPDDPLVERVIRGDPTVLDDIRRRPTDLRPRRPRRPYGRWDLVVGLVERGAPVSTTGRTPLHLAAGAGELAVVQVLLDHGADPTARIPTSTPRRGSGPSSSTTRRSRTSSPRASTTSRRCSPPYS